MALTLAEYYIHGVRDNITALEYQFLSTHCTTTLSMPMSLEGFPPPTFDLCAILGNSFFRPSICGL